MMEYFAQGAPAERVGWYWQDIFLPFQVTSQLETNHSQKTYLVNFLTYFLIFLRHFINICPWHFYRLENYSFIICFGTDQRSTGAFSVQNCKKISTRFVIHLTSWIFSQKLPRAPLLFFYCRVCIWNFPNKKYIQTEKNQAALLDCSHVRNISPMMNFTSN